MSPPPLLILLLLFFTMDAWAYGTEEGDVVSRHREGERDDKIFIHATALFCRTPWRASERIPRSTVSHVQYVIISFVQDTNDSKFIAYG
jgi:hypothetical protein